MLTLNRKPQALLTVLLLLFSCGNAFGQTYEFRRIDTADGLPNSQVNNVFRDKRGFLWFGTEMGLSRYDGFRFTNFFYNAADKTSLPSSQIREIAEDADGQLWIHTNEGYCIYDPATEKFDKHLDAWMQSHGMSGHPDFIHIDGEKNLWIAVNGQGCWFYEWKTRKSFLFKVGLGGKTGQNKIVANLTGQGQHILLTYNDGSVLRLDSKRKRVSWQSTELCQPWRKEGRDITAHVDHQANYWFFTSTSTNIYSTTAQRWFGSAAEFFAFIGVKGQMPNVLVKWVTRDKGGNTWVATEHNGIYIVDGRTHMLRHLVNEPGNLSSLPDNTVQNIFVDGEGAVWIGTYKNGVAYYSPALSHYATIPIGDVCTLAEDQQGLYWCGTNDAGIVCYNPSTQRQARLTMQQTLLGSDAVVSSLAAKDGSLWFGAFNGGLTRLKDGHFTAYRQGTSGLANDNVWALAEDREGNIVVGTLGGGLQLLNPETGRFTTFDTRNSQISSDFISSIFVDGQNRIFAGHSQSLSIVSADRRTIQNIQNAKDGTPFLSRSVNQLFVDRRGLVWNATMSGLNVYDPKTDQIMTPLADLQAASSVTEDANGEMWIALAHGVVRVKVSQNKAGYEFFATYYDELDGLQKRRFNYRSILRDHRGNIVIGGQDGINVIPPHKSAGGEKHAQALFSGVVLFDHPLSVGERYNGRVVLENAVDVSRTLRLSHSENAFTVLLASNRVELPQKARFLYRLEGFGDDRWMMTATDNPSVTYTNLSPGTYHLLVRVVNRDGSISPETSELKVVVMSPFYLTPWAFLVYLLIVGIIVWQSWRIVQNRRRARREIAEAQRSRELDEMKLTFLTSISHELRTPLALIIGPLKSLLGREDNEEKRTRLELILRNAERLLKLVNQTLDIRKIEKGKAQLQLVTGDIVKFTSDICNSFRDLTQKQVELTFEASEPSIRMTFDDDKMEKIVSNLVSNAYKYTPEGGQIVVGVKLEGDNSENSEGSENFENSEKPAQKHLRITVADTGVGISDSDKEHIFDRFYQARRNHRDVAGGSGIGLNLVREFTLMHDGTVSVADREGGGTVFTVVLPYRLDETLPQATTSQDPTDTATDIASSSSTGGKQQLQRLSEQLREGDYEVLVVDDSEDFLTFIAEVLSDTYRVRTAHNGREALRMVMEKRPDIILSDVMMPEMDGNELCQAIKGNPKTERIPFVMLTARLSTEHKIEGMAIGADDYITKPFNLDLLNLRIGNLIKWRRATPLGEKVAPQIKEQEITSLDEKLVGDATAYIESRLDDPTLSVETMSEQLAMSRVHLYKRLLQATGHTPSEFIRLIRLRHAEQLLREGGFNVSEVAYKVGFNNPRYFSKYFKEMYGVMPSHYRKGETAQEGDKD